MIISVDIEKLFDKIQNTFHDKVLEKLGIDRIYFNKIKTTLDKPTAYVILSRGNWDSFLYNLEWDKDVHCFYSYSI